MLKSFKIIGGRVYGDIGMMGNGCLTVKKGIWLSREATETARSILTQCIIDGVKEGVLTVSEDEMVDKTHCIYNIEGATGDNGKDYY